MATSCSKAGAFSDDLTKISLPGAFMIRPLNGREFRREAARQQQREAKKQRKEVK